MKILLTKETRAGETRVALIPADVKSLCQQGYSLFVEHNAGEKAGFPDSAYEEAGGIIRYLSDTASGYQQFFKGIDIVVRVKRPAREREQLENQAIWQAIMIGALDPLEKNSSHMEEYAAAGITAYSIDQFNLSENDPKNILASMSKIAGRLALLDAINHFPGKANKVVIIGFGIAGQAAFNEAIHQKLFPLVILPQTTNRLLAAVSNAQGEMKRKTAVAMPLNENSSATSTKQFTTAVEFPKDSNVNNIKMNGADYLLLDTKKSLIEQQEIVKNALVDADLVITSARKPSQSAPLLIPEKTLQVMKKNSVIVDLALSEGGNVEGSEHDKTKRLGNDIIVTNTSGYPKKFPFEASQAWSKVSLNFILELAKG